jgi:hypothetical protein
VWQKCEARSCLHCGPELRERDLAHDLGHLTKDGRPVLRRVIANEDATWNRLRAKIKRAGSGWVAYPQRDGTLVVYAHAGMTGALVTEPTDELASDYEGIPPNERIRRPREWALHTKSAGAAGTPSWKLLGATTKTDRVPDILRRLGLYRGEVDEGAVPLNAWEVHNFEVPLESQGMRLLIQALDLEEGRPRPASRVSGIVEGHATASGMAG